MNVFILNSGRCGSTTFIKACQHISNYSAAHESHVNDTGAQRFAYPDNHIEADNRLSWMLGRLDRIYGDRAYYVHLMRSPEATISSFVKRADFGIMKAYREGILLHEDNNVTDSDVAEDYLDTVTSNIALFLQNKSRQMSFRLENAEQDFGLFWEEIGAQGDKAAALKEWGKAYNASS